MFFNLIFTFAYWNHFYLFDLVSRHFLHVLSHLLFAFWVMRVKAYRPPAKVFVPIGMLSSLFQLIYVSNVFLNVCHVCFRLVAICISWSDRKRQRGVFWRPSACDSFPRRSLSWNGDIRRVRHNTASPLLVPRPSFRLLLPSSHGGTGGCTLQHWSFLNINPACSCSQGMNWTTSNNKTTMCLHCNSA